MSENILWCHSRGQEELLASSGEARNAAKHLAVQRTTTTSKNDPAQYGLTAKAEEPWAGGNTGPGVRVA